MHDVHASHPAVIPDIIIPIHNAYDATKRCVESVLAYTPAGCTIILIDDCSTDPRMQEVFHAAQSRREHSIILLKQTANAGFVASANRGIAHSTRDIILLNSDTIVGEGWVEGLTACATAFSDCASVTPLSNNASIYSILHQRDAGGPLPRHLFPAAAQAVRTRSLRLRPRIPTGVGFCMYMRRTVIDQIGLFDPMFSPGYGEENDWCMRALAAGYAHYLDDATFVYHEGGASMRAAGILRGNASSLERHERLLRKKHPSYRKRVLSFLWHDTLMPRIRSQSADALLDILSQDRPRIGFLLHEDPQGGMIGGTERHVLDLVHSFEHAADCYTIFPTHAGLTVRRQISGCTTIRHFADASTDDGTHVTSFCALLEAIPLDLLHVHHVLGTGFKLIDAAAERGIPLVYSIHDHYALSPNYLLFERPRRRSIRDLLTPATLKRRQHEDWHASVRRSLSAVAYIVSPSRHTAALFRSAFGQLPEPHVIPHGHGNDRRCSPLVKAPTPTVAFLGFAHSQHKGADVAAQVALALGTYDIACVFIGSDARHFPSLQHASHIRCIGQYHYDDAFALLRDSGAHACCLLPLWHETFSYTLSESWHAGMPAYVTPFGALAERVRASGGGRIAPSLDANTIAHDLATWLASDAYLQSVAAVEAMTLRTRDAMATEYARLYATLLPDTFHGCFSTHDSAGTAYPNEIIRPSSSPFPRCVAPSPVSSGRCDHRIPANLSCHA